MDEATQIAALLGEIRDLQREYLDEYRRVTQSFLTKQDEALRQQEVGLARQGRAMRTLAVFLAVMVGLWVVAAMSR